MTLNDFQKRVIWRWIIMSILTIIGFIVMIFVSYFFQQFAVFAMIVNKISTADINLLISAQTAAVIAAYFLGFIFRGLYIINADTVIMNMGDLQLEMTQKRIEEELERRRKIKSVSDFHSGKKFFDPA